MPKRQLTGTRLRNRRLDRGLRQAALAQAVGISASYLNLIEHNRRRIGGKLLADLARVLGVDPDMLVEGTAPTVLAPLKEAAAEFRSAGPELDQVEELVARFPGWAALIGAQSDRIAQLQARSQQLTDRLTHDPQLATSLHEVISAATAIRSTASILVNSDDLDAQWQARFHRNIDTDSRRLSESSTALMGYLDRDAARGSQLQSPLEIAEASIVKTGFHMPDLEHDGHSSAELADQTANPQAREILAGWYDTYRQDARRLPLDAFSAAARGCAYDSLALARQFDQPLDRIYRRLAALPEGEDHPVMGLAVCDQAGVVLFQKPVMEVTLPRSGAACPLWPLYQALSQPGRPLRRRVTMPGASQTEFECSAYARDHGRASYDGPSQIVSTMLVRPVAPEMGQDVGRVGPGCRVCPVESCRARRQPSILGGAA